MTNPTNANHISRASSWLSSCQSCTSKTTRPNCATTAKNCATSAMCCRTDLRRGGALAVVSLSSSRWSPVWISVASIKNLPLHKYHFTVLTLAIRPEIHGKLSCLRASLRSAVGSAVNGTVSGSLLEVPSKDNPAQCYYNRSKSYPKYSMSLANRSLTIFSSSDV